MRKIMTSSSKTKSQLIKELAEANQRIDELTSSLPGHVWPSFPSSQCEERYRFLFNHMRSGAIIYRAVDEGRDFVIVDFNVAAEKIEKISRSHVVGMRVTSVFPGIKDFGLLEMFQRVWATGKAEHHPVSQYRDNRILGWRENYVFRLTSGEVVAIYDDVTAQRQMEEELRRNQALLETIINNIPDIICLKDDQGRWLLANDYDLHLFQLDDVDYKGKTDAELAPYSAFYEDAFRGCMDTDNVAWSLAQPSRGEEVIPRPDGTSKVFDVVKIPLFNPDGSRHALVVAGRDITELRRAQRKNEENEKRFRLLFQNAPMPYQSLDGAGRLIDVNRKWLHILGYSRSEVLGRSFVDFMAPLSRKHFEASFAKLKKHGFLQNVEFEMLKKDGSSFLVAFNGEVLSDGKGSPVHTLCVFRDITEQKELEEMLHHSHAKLEEQVQKRTWELVRKSKEQQETLLTLQKKSQDLHDANIALKVFLEQGSKAREELEGQILANIKDLVFPYLDELDLELVDRTCRVYVDIIRKKIEEVASPFAKQLTSKLVGLTPRELQVAELVKQGRSNKEIARLLHISLGTADVYRNKIRKKLGLQNKKINLRVYLLTQHEKPLL
ncbi:MAG: PAS domain S-box protein [Desulfobulbaceae bacterium]|nr:PAS domain S-box protein [Desulfobulbaceae bacterium]HIJ90787.1 PAS domain S-box protein [Deltaproteobacteria bacterium]